MGQRRRKKGGGPPPPLCPGAARLVVHYQLRPSCLLLRQPRNCYLLCTYSTILSRCWAMALHSPKTILQITIGSSSSPHLIEVLSSMTCSWICLKGWIGLDVKHGMDAGQTDRDQTPYFPLCSLCLCLQFKETRLTLRYSAVQLVSPRIWRCKNRQCSVGGFCVPSWSQCAPAVTPE